ncbi:MAG: holo-ACP synthase [Clostridioides sp.]|jgi:holo-[acyl-carrier protein] synthase|nr:holo-ACP synthase [Clostridioides sp.]
MHILNIGTDIVEICRVKEAVERNPRFLERNFTELEIEYFKSKDMKANSIAGNFSAKEAVAKSLGTGVRGFNLKDIEVLRDEIGMPFVNTHGKLSAICEDYGILEIKVSISHCREYAVANAIAIV